MFGVPNMLLAPIDAMKVRRAICCSCVSRCLEVRRVKDALGLLVVPHLARTAVLKGNMDDTRKRIKHHPRGCELERDVRRAYLAIVEIAMQIRRFEFKPYEYQDRSTTLIGPPKRSAADLNCSLDALNHKSAPVLG